MLITYLKENGYVMAIIQGFPVVEEVNNQLLMENGTCPLLNDLTKTGWGFYKDKRIVKEMGEDETELPLYMKDLDLEPVAERPLSLKEEVDQLKTKVDKLNEDVEKLKEGKEKL